MNALGHAPYGADVEVLGVQGLSVGPIAALKGVLPSNRRRF